MNSTFTPGPWVTNRAGFSTVYVEARLRDGWLQEVAACGPTEAGSEQQEANARLIAAAPDLLDALKLIAAEAADGAGSTGPAGWMGAIARVAIAKATEAA